MLAIEAIQRTFTYKITEVQHLNYWERQHELKLYSLQRRRERYIIIYIGKRTQHMVPNIDGTMEHKIKTRAQCVIQYPPNINPTSIHSRKCNNCIWASVAQHAAKISERH